MANLWQSLSPENRNKLAEFYEEKFGKLFLPPGRHDRDIKLDTKLESLEEIGKTMTEKPNYAIDKQGREG